MRLLILPAIALASCASLLADFSYQESSKMTGGTLYGVLKMGGPFTRRAREAQITDIAVKGNKEVRSSKTSATITDLDAETITEINFDKKTYSVTTFAQIKAGMEKALEQAKAEKSKAKAEPQSKDNVDVKFTVSAKATGETKNVNGIDTKGYQLNIEALVTDKDNGQSGTMNIANDAWMGTVPGYNELRQFQIRLGQKLASFTPAEMEMAATQPQMVQGMAEAAKELSKLQGVPISSVTMIGSGAAADLRKAATAEQTDQSKDKKPSGGEVAGAIAGRITGFGGFGKKKKEEPKAEEKTDAPQAALLVQMTQEMSMFSTAAIDSSKFAVPAGFKMVDSDIAKRAAK